jgi:hypothetical protein
MVNMSLHLLWLYIIFGWGLVYNHICNPTDEKPSTWLSVGRQTKIDVSLSVILLTIVDDIESSRKTNHLIIARPFEEICWNRRTLTLNEMFFPFDSIIRLKSHFSFRYYKAILFLEIYRLVWINDSHYFI